MDIGSIMTATSLKWLSKVLFNAHDKFMRIFQDKCFASFPVENCKKNEDMFRKELTQMNVISHIKWIANQFLKHS